MSNWVDLSVANAASSGLTQYSIITATSADTAKHSTAVGSANVHGVLQDRPTSTAHPASIRVFGETFVRPTSDAVLRFANLTAATAGLCQSATASSAQNCFGFALEAIAASTARGANATIKAFVNFAGGGER